MSGLRLLVAAAALSVAASAASRAAELVPAECWFEANALQTVDCYRAILPVDRDDPRAGTVDLPVAVLHASTRAPAGDPVLYLEGGPGAPTFDSGYPGDEDYSEFWWEHSSAFRRTRDFILFDQRGMGLARPSLDCPELHKLDGDIDHWPGYDDAMFEQEFTALAACHKRLVSEGVALDHFGTRESADDVADVLALLGYERVNLYGVSYGTRLALEVMRRHPAIVRSAVLDGVYPPDIDTELDFPAAIDGAFSNLFADCAADPACARMAPDAKQSLEAMVIDLDLHPRDLELYDHETYGRGVMVPFDGNLVLSGMVDMLYDAYWLTYIPLVVGRAAGGEVDALSYFYVDPSFAQQGLAEGGYINVECRESKTLDAALLAEVAAARGIWGSVAEAWSLVPYCAVWPVARDPLAVEGPVVSDTPTLLMSGRYDPVTPAFFADHAAETLSDSTHLVFQAGGHAVSFWFDCALDTAADFFEQPDPQAVRPPRCRDFSRPAAFARRF